MSVNGLGCYLRFGCASPRYLPPRPFRSTYLALTTLYTISILSTWILINAVIKARFRVSDHIVVVLGRRFLTALLVFAMGYLRNRMRSLRTRQAAADVYSSLRRDHFMAVLRKKIRRTAESDLLLRNPWNVCLGWDRSGCKGRAGVAWDANWWTEIIQTPTWMVGADPCSSTGDPVPWWLT